MESNAASMSGTDDTPRLTRFAAATDIRKDRVVGAAQALSITISRSPRSGLKASESIRSFDDCPHAWENPDERRTPIDERKRVRVISLMTTGGAHSLIGLPN